MDMQWNRMLWWMGAVLLLACLILSKRTMSQDIAVAPNAVEEKKPLVAGKNGTHPVPGAPDAAALAAFMQKARAGDARARSVLGIMTVLGIGVDADSEHNADFFANANLQDNSRYMRSLLGFAKAAMIPVNMLDDQGRLISEEEEERRTYEMLASAAENGDSGIWLALGVACASGTGVDRDFVQAASWLTKAAKNGDAISQALLGMMYETGMGVPRDQDESARWYARFDSQPALTDEETLQLLDQTLEVAEGYIEKMLTLLPGLAEKGDAQAQFRLGELYEEMEPVRNDLAACAWYRKAAFQEHVKAQYALGRIYEEGRDGISPDRKEALKWYKKAASHRDMRAMKKVAELQ